MYATCVAMYMTPQWEILTTELLPERLLKISPMVGLAPFAE